MSEQLTADNVALQPSDLPGSFSSKSSSSSSSSSSDAQASADADQCFRSAAGTDLSTFDKERTAKAKRAFDAGQGLDGVEVTADVEVYRDPGNVTPQIAAMAKPEVGECFRKLFVDEFTAAGATVGDVAIAPAKVEGVGDGQAGFLITGPVTIKGVDVNFGIEFDFTQVGRFGLMVTVLSLAGTPDHALAVTSMKAMSERVPK